MSRTGRVRHGGELTITGKLSHRAPASPQRCDLAPPRACTQNSWMGIEGNSSPFVRNLARKSQRAMRSARLGLEDGDPDGAISRAYFAMFNIARAALLCAGVPEEGLPSDHKELIAAFRQYAVQSGQIDRDLAGALNKTEDLRLQADYAGTVIDPRFAADAVRRAETFVKTIERTFALHAAAKPTDADA